MQSLCNVAISSQPCNIMVTSKYNQSLCIERDRGVLKHAMVRLMDGGVRMNSVQDSQATDLYRYESYYVIVGASEPLQFAWAR